VRAKKMRMRKSGETLLKVVFSKKDDFDYATAVRISSNRVAGLLPFTFKGDDRRPDVYYNVSDLINIQTFCESKISLQQFFDLVLSFLAVLESVNASGLLEKNLLLAKEYVFVDESSRIHLAYLPLSGVNANERSILELLMFIASSAQFVDENDARFAEAFLEYLKTQQVFSIVEARSFFSTGDTSSREHARQLNNLFVRPTPSYGRDFVSEASGVQSRDQQAANRSFNAGSMLLAPKASTSDQNASMTSPSNRQAVRGRYSLTRLSDGKEWLLSGNRISLGRSASSDIQVSDSTKVSRLHAWVNMHEDQLSISDANSVNGTFVNGIRINSSEPMRLYDGDVIVLGENSYSVNFV